MYLPFAMDAFVVLAPSPACHARADDAIFKHAVASEDQVHDGAEEQQAVDRMKALCIGAAQRAAMTCRNNALLGLDDEVLRSLKGATGVSGAG